jgi:hypothetical protein
MYKQALESCKQRSNDCEFSLQMNNRQLSRDTKIRKNRQKSIVVPFLNQNKRLGTWKRRILKYHVSLLLKKDY